MKTLLLLLAILLAGPAAAQVTTAAERAEADAKSQAQLQQLMSEANDRARQSQAIFQNSPRRKGEVFAQQSGTVWLLQRKPNPLTDKDDVTVTSRQKNDGGAVAEVTGKCVGDVFDFTALIVDGDGHPTRLPDYTPSNEGNGGFVAGEKRLNDDTMTAASFYAPRYNNEFAFLVFGSNEYLQRNRSFLELNALNQLFGGGVPIGNFGGTWRELVQVETSKGSIIIELPT